MEPFAFNWQGFFLSFFNRKAKSQVFWLIPLKIKTTNLLNTRTIPLEMEEEEVDSLKEEEIVGRNNVPFAIEWDIQWTNVTTNSFMLGKQSAYSTSWIVDTGAIDHVTPNKSFFFFTTFHLIKLVRVTLPNGSMVTTKYSGSIYISDSLQLFNVLYDVASLKMIGLTKLRDSLYKLTKPITLSVPSTSFINFVHIKNTWSSIQQTKPSKLPFMSSTTSTSYAFELVQMDIWEPLACNLYKESFIKIHALLYPQQNSIIERKHNHILNVTRALLFQAHLPKNFLSFAITYAIHLINKFPTPKQKSPFEMLHQIPPTFLDLKVFDCLCFASTLDQRGKLDSRSCKCIFLGFKYSTKGYMIFDLGSREIQISQCSTTLYPLSTILSYNHLSPYHLKYTLAISNIFEPKTYAQAIQCEHWIKAMKAELHALEANHTWLVAKGYLNKKELIFLDTFSHMAKLTTMRLLLALKLDVDNAFLHGDLHKEVYIEFPPYLTSTKPNQVCYFTKSLYYLKQTSRKWFSKLSSSLQSIGFTHSQYDHYLFIKSTSSSFVTLLIQYSITSVKHHLHTTFGIKDLGNLKYFLGLKVSRSHKGIHLSQCKYVLDILFYSSLLAAKPCDTPMIKNNRLLYNTNGEDTRRTFTSYLYKALIEEKVETYIDEKLEKGDEISAALVKAIEESHVSVVIFSENYASSKWCLEELNKIMECKKEKGQDVIPVFYNMDPSHVRKQMGSYEQAFAKHEGDPSCNKWKAALTQASNLVGWDSRTYRTESEFLKDIVETVLQKLAMRYPNQRKAVVGIEKSYEEIESLLKIESSEVKTLGIWGMGGMGKTTLATALYDDLSCKFEGRCFLTNVREKSDKLHVLRDELFSNLLPNKNHDFDHFDIIRLRRKKVFIVLDDVATSEQLEKLILEYDFLGPGSRLIITTRNKQILSVVDEIYPMEELSSHHSLQLFCLTVFGEKQPKDGYEDLSTRVISHCKGIPLALKVLGASLRKASKEVWECELRKLQKIPNMEIHNTLKLSYDGLDCSQKEIFLDLACFFKGGKRDWVTGLLEAFGFFPESGIQVLLDKALITISSNNYWIEMHDLIQEMGREIVHQESIKHPGRRSRLWKHDEVVHVLRYNWGTDVVEGIILDLDKLTRDLCLSSDSFAKMLNLRFLQIRRQYWNNKSFNVFLPNGLESLSDKLRYIFWDQCCLESFPSNFCAEHLVELCMRDSKLKRLWDGVQNLMNLKTIDLSKSRYLIEIPNLSKAEKVEIVNLNACESLHQFHPSMLSLPKLTYLYLSGCTKIESLNVHSKSLCSFGLWGCSSLKEISVASEEMTEKDLSGTAICALSSSMLSLRGCTSLESLNVHLKSLHELDLNGCSSLKELSLTSEEMTKLDLSHTLIQTLSLSLPKLKYLYLRGCKEIESFNVDLKSLSVLDLNGCSSLKEFSVISEEMKELNISHTAICALPSSIGHFLSLEELHLCGTDVESFPANMKNLSKLRWLHLTNCRKVVSLPELPPSMEELYLNGCRKLLSLSELPPSLRALYLNDCWKLVSLPELPPSLEDMIAINCTCLETNNTQLLVLHHMLQNHIHYLHKKYLNYSEHIESQYFLFPGDHVTLEECGFCTTESSIYIPYLPKSNLCGFIYCIILSEEVLLKQYVACCCSIYQDGIQVSWDHKGIFPSNLISNHMLFWYCDITKFDRISEVCGHFSNITFIFEFNRVQESIKGCGVFPVYATTSGFKLVGSCSKEIIECQSITQKISVGVGCSNNENVDDQEQLFPASKRMRTTPETIFLL
ncbi:TMV resistance protein N, partial [Mucuna pruriens]